LLPPLEHAPDQIASRPFETDSVIELPVVNDADPVLPTPTEIPAGLDETRSPLRPEAETVSVAVDAGGGGADGGVTVRAAVRVTPPNTPLMVAEVLTDTADVPIGNVWLVDPAGTVTLAGTVATPLVLESVTDAPPAGAAAVRVTVPVTPFPPTTLDGFTLTDDNDAGAGADAGVTVIVVVFVAPPNPAVIVASVFAETAEVEIVNVRLVEPAATVTLAGTVAAALLLDSVTSAPPLGAADVRVTVPVDALPPTSVDGLAPTDDNAGDVVAARGSTLLVADHGPAVPTALTPRTRQKWRTADKPVVVNCEAATPASTSSGAVKLLESSI